MSEMNQLGDRIKKARICAGYSQVELAKALGCTARTAWGWENGKTPTPALFKGIADATKVDIAWLYGGGEEFERSNPVDRDHGSWPVGYPEGPDLPNQHD